MFLSDARQQEVSLLLFQFALALPNLYAKCLYSYRDDLPKIFYNSSSVQKNPLPVDARRSKTSLLKLRCISNELWFDFILGFNFLSGLDMVFSENGFEKYLKKIQSTLKA